MRTNLSFGKKIAVIALALVTAITSMTVDWNSLLSVKATTSGTLSLPADENANPLGAGQTFTQTINAPSAGADQSQRLSGIQMMFGAAEGEAVSADVSVALYKNTFSADPSALVYSDAKNVSFNAGTDGGYAFKVYDGSSDISLTGAEPLFAVVTVTSLSTANEGAVVRYGTDASGQAMVYSFDDVVNLEPETAEEAPEEEEAGSDDLISTLFGDSYDLSAESEPTEDIEEIEESSETEVVENESAGEATPDDSAEVAGQPAETQEDIAEASQETAEETTPSEEATEDANDTEQTATEPEETAEETEEKPTEETVEKVQEESVEEKTDEEIAEEETKNELKEEEIFDTEPQELTAFVGLAKAVVKYDPGVFPAGCTLSVRTVSASEKVAVESAVDRVRDASKNVAASYTYDVTVYDKDGNEVQPDTSKGSVTVTFSLAQAVNQNLTADVYHIEDNMSAEKLPSGTTTQGGSPAVVAQTEGFSYYTVEFTYGTLQYVLNGDSSVALSEILSEVGLSGTPSNVKFSNTNLLSVTNESGTWVVTALQAFTSAEWLRVTIEGVEYEIIVTDELTPDEDGITDVSDAYTMTLTGASVSFNRSAQTPTISFTPGADAVEEVTTNLANKTYTTITYGGSSTEPVNAGDYLVAVTYNDGTHKGYWEGNFTIERLNITNNLDISPESGTQSYDYTGSAINYAADITSVKYKVSEDSKITLTQGEDFYFSHNDVTSAGNKTIYIVGKGNYTGTETYSFTIRPALSNARIILSNNETYYAGSEAPCSYSVTYGNEITLTVSKVLIGDLELVKNTDYVVSRPSAGTNAGKQKLTITGNGDYINQGSIYVYFTINPKSITSANFGWNTSYTYDATAKEPIGATSSEETNDFSVTLNETSLYSGKDYTITSYANNTNAGNEASVTITGTGNYTGTKTGNFTIKSLNFDDVTATLDKASYTYTGGAIKPVVTVETAGKTIPEADYEVSYDNNINASSTEPTVTLNPSATSNLTGTKSVTFIIAAAGEVLLTFTLPDGTKKAVQMSDAHTPDSDPVYTAYAVSYNGAAQDPIVTVKAVVAGSEEEKTLTTTTDYTLTYTNDVKVATGDPAAGSYSLAKAPTIKFTGQGNYNETNVTLTYDITARSLGEGDPATGVTVDTSNAATNTYVVNYNGNKLTESTDGGSTGDYVVTTVSDEGTCGKIEGINNYTGYINLGESISGYKVTYGYTYQYLGTHINCMQTTVTAQDGVCDGFETLYAGQGRPYMTLSNTSGTLIDSGKYEITYDVAAADQKAGTTVTATIKPKSGQSEYYGSIRISYKINPLYVHVYESTEKNVVWSYSLLTYSGSATSDVGEKKLTYGYTGKSITPTEQLVFDPNTYNHFGETSVNVVAYDDRTGTTTTGIPKETLTNGTDYVAYTSDGKTTIGPLADTYEGMYLVFSNANFGDGSSQAKYVISKCVIEKGELSNLESGGSAATIYNGTTGALATALPTQTYTGAVLNPFKNISLTYKGIVKLTEGTDYTLTYAYSSDGGSNYTDCDASDIKDVGLYRITFNTVADGSYDVEANTTYTFEILAIDFSGTTVKFVSSDTINYDGNSHTLYADGEAANDFYVLYNGARLVPGTDYQITATTATSFVNDLLNQTVTVDGAKGPAEYTFTLTGVGSYSGTRDIKFYVRADLSQTTLFKGMNSSTGSLAAIKSGSDADNGYSVYKSGNTFKNSMEDSTKSDYVVWAIGYKENFATDTGLEYGDDYTVSLNKTVPGKVTVTIAAVSGSKICTGSQTQTTAFYGRIEDAAISGLNTNYAYTGSAIVPELTVKYNGTTLTKGTDYTAAAVNNTDVRTTASLDGAPTVTLTGTGYYTGTYEGKFNILYDLSKAAVKIYKSGTDTELVSTPYTGSPITGDVVVSVGGDALAAGTDYTLGEFTNNVEVGTTTIAVNPVSDRSYNSNSGSFKITGVVLNNANTTITVNENFTYDGTAKVPDDANVSVVYDGTPLTKDVHYELTCSNNIKAGEAKITVKGKGGYGGTATGTFTIDPRDIGETTIAVTDPNYAGGATPHPTIKVTDSINGSTKTLTEGTDYTYTSVNGTNWDANSTGTVTITGKGNYTSTKTSDAFTVQPANLGDENVTYIPPETLQAEYTGTTITAENLQVKILTGNDESGNPTYNTLTKDTDYKVTYNNGSSETSSMVDAGEYKIKIEALSSNYTGYRANLTFTVSPKNLPETFTATGASTGYTHGEIARTDDTTKTNKYELADVENQTWIGTYVTPLISLYDVTEGINAENSYLMVKDTDYTLSYTNNLDAGTGATVTITGKGNYAGSVNKTFTKTFTIGEDISSATIGEVSPTQELYDGRNKTPEVEVYLGGATLEQGTEYTVDNTDLLDVGSYDITINGVGKYFGSVTGTPTNGKYKIVKRDAGNTTYTVTPSSESGLRTMKYTGNVSADVLNGKFPHLLTKGDDNNYYYYYTTYTGSAIEPTFDVDATFTNTDGSGSTTEQIADNKTARSYNTNTNVGSVYSPAVAWITLADKNGNPYNSNYTELGTEETIPFRFVILPGNGELTISAENLEYDNGNPVTPEITVSDASLNELELNTDYQATFKDADGNVINRDEITEIGEYTVSVEGKGNYAGQDADDATFYVYGEINTAKDYCDITVISEDDLTDPEVTVVVGGNILTQGTDYIVTDITHPSGSVPGHVYVWTNNDNLYPGDEVVYYYGEGAIQVSGIEDTYTYTGSPIRPIPTVTDGDGDPLAYTITYRSSTDGTDCVTVGTVTYSIEIETTVTTGAVTVSKSGTYDIVAADLAGAEVAAISDQTYTGSAITPDVTVTLNGNTITPSDGYTVTYANNTEIGTATVTITGTNNLTGERKVLFNITDGSSDDGGDGGDDSGGGSDGGGSGGGGSSGGSSSGGGGSYIAGYMAGLTSATTTSSDDDSSSDVVYGSVKLKWKANKNYDGYVIYRSTKKNGTYKKIATVSSSKSSYTNKKLKSGKVYYYYMKAYKTVNGKRIYSKRSKISKVTVE